MARRELAGRVIIITGASSGIGAATATECARAGMDVVINARRRDRLNQTAAGVRELGREAEIVVGDVTAPDTTARLLDAAERRFGGFHAVFANAGYGQHLPVHAFPRESMRRIFEVNYFASVELVTAAGRRLIERRRGGHLLLTSSCVSKITIAGHGLYAATKAAQYHACRAMRTELEPHGIDVSCVNPITTATEFFQVADAISDPRMTDTRILESTPKMFLQRPERVARAIVKCLRQPRAEVWTSRIVHASAALMMLAPSLMDVVMRWQLPLGKPEASAWAARGRGAEAQSLHSAS